MRRIARGTDVERPLACLLLRRQQSRRCAMSGTEFSGTAATGGRRDGITTATIVIGAVTGLGFVAAGIARLAHRRHRWRWRQPVLVVAPSARRRSRRAGRGRDPPHPAACRGAQHSRIGGLAGALALFWSVIAEVLVVALVVLAVMHTRRTETEGAFSGGPGAAGPPRRCCGSRRPRSRSDAAPASGSLRGASAVATWTRQPGFALAYTCAPVASTWPALRSPSCRAASAWVML